MPSSAFLEVGCRQRRLQNGAAAAMMAIHVSGRATANSGTIAWHAAPQQVGLAAAAKRVHAPVAQSTTEERRGNGDKFWRAGCLRKTASPCQEDQKRRAPMAGTRQRGCAAGRVAPTLRTPSLNPLW